MQKKIYYVWKLGDKLGGGCETKATTMLSNKDAKIWDKIFSKTKGKDFKTISPLVQIAHSNFIGMMQNKYLSDVEGDICISEYKNFEVCMESLQAHGEVKIEAIVHPTIH